MDRVGLVDAHDEGPSGTGAVKVGIRDTAVHGRRDSGDCVGHDSGIRSLGRRRSDFFVVEEDGHRNVGGRFVVGIFSTRSGIVDESLQPGKDRREVVETGRIEEFFLDSPQRGGLRIVQIKFKIDNLVYLDAQLVGNDLQQQGFLAFLPLVELIVGSLFQDFLGVFVRIGSNNSAVLRSRRYDRGRVVLFVDGKSLSFFRRLQVDAQGADPGDGIFQVDQSLFGFEIDSAAFVVLGRLWFSLYQNTAAHG